MDVTEVTYERQIYNNFNYHFTISSKSIHGSILSPNINFGFPSNNSSVFLWHTAESDVLAATKNIKKNYKLSDILERFLLLTIDFVCKLVCVLIYLSIDQEVFPDAFKTSRVTPVHKKGFTTNVVNYRPVSVLCNLGEVSECIIFNRMLNFLNRNDQLSCYQLDYRKIKNTELFTLTLFQKQRLPSRKMYMS